jgi:hypothetical protein
MPLRSQVETQIVRHVKVKGKDGGFLDADPIIPKPYRPNDRYDDLQLLQRYSNNTKIVKDAAGTKELNKEYLNENPFNRLNPQGNEVGVTITQPLKSRMQGNLQLRFGSRVGEVTPLLSSVLLGALRADIYSPADIA